MPMITIEEAAKKSKKDPRELRRLLRNGTLKGKKEEGSWTVDSNSLANLGKADGKAGKAAKAPKKSKGKAAPADDSWDEGEEGEE